MDARAQAANGEARRLRQASGLSLSETAEEVGLAGPGAPGTVWRWETGRRRPRGQAAIRYAILLETLRARETP